MKLGDDSLLHVFRDAQAFTGSVQVVTPFKVHFAVFDKKQICQFLVTGKFCTFTFKVTFTRCFFWLSIV